MRDLTITEECSCGGRFAITADGLLPTTARKAVEQYVDAELSDAEKYQNREPLDDSGVWSLHALAASVYAMGWEDGERSAAERARCERSREDRRRRGAAKAAREAETAETADERDDDE